MGYSTSQSVYLCLDPQTHRTYISRHVSLNEAEFPSISLSSKPPSDHTINHYNIFSPSPTILPLHTTINPNVITITSNVNPTLETSSSDISSPSVDTSAPITSLPNVAS